MPLDLTLVDRLLRRGRHFDFFKAVRLLENAHPEMPRVGESARPQDDPVRFAQDPTLEFEGSSVAGCTQQAEGRPFRMAVNFFGLLGPNGALPLHFTEYARDRIRHASDHTLVRFLDIFHHRMVSLFYRAWSSAQPVVSRDRKGQDRFANWVASLYGDGMAPMRQRDAIQDAAKQHFAGMLACQARNAEGLRRILSHYLGLPVRIEEFAGAWLPLPPEIRSRLGSDSLGISVVLGERVWDRQHKFRIVVGPVGLADYERLLPTGGSLRRVVDWVRNYAGDALAWEMQLVLRKEEVPPLRLGSHSRLGWTTWAPGDGLPRDRDDLKLQSSTALAKLA